MLREVTARTLGQVSVIDRFRTVLKNMSVN